MADWSDWYTREDPTTWVLPEILRRRAAEHPDRPLLKFGGGAWISYGEVNAQANRVAKLPGARRIPVLDHPVPDRDQDPPLTRWQGRGVQVLKILVGGHPRDRKAGHRLRVPRPQERPPGP